MDKSNIDISSSLLVNFPSVSAAKATSGVRILASVKNKEIVSRLSAKPELNAQEKATLKMAQTGVGEPAEWCVDDVVAWCKAH